MLLPSVYGRLHSYSESIPDYADNAYYPYNWRPLLGIIRKMGGLERRQHYACNRLTMKSARILCEGPADRVKPSAPQPQVDTPQPLVAEQRRHRERVLGQRLFAWQDDSMRSIAKCEVASLTREGRAAAIRLPKRILRSWGQYDLNFVNLGRCVKRHPSTMVSAVSTGCFCSVLSKK